MSRAFGPVRIWQENCVGHVVSMVKAAPLGRCFLRSHSKIVPLRGRRRDQEEEVLSSAS
jgi:hypothetical protein